jgi:polysaccharide biosynthesis protein PelF
VPGHAGIITAIASPQETARAILELLRNPARWGEVRRVATARVNALYDRARMLAAYDDIYQSALGETNGGHRLRAS